MIVYEDFNFMNFFERIWTLYNFISRKVINESRCKAFGFFIELAETLQSVRNDHFITVGDSGVLLRN